MKKKKWIGALIVVSVCSLTLNGIVIIRERYMDKLLVKSGLKEGIEESDWTLQGWENSLDQLRYDADIAFFGDSITYGGDLQKYFPDSKIINLGIPGDTLFKMAGRAEMLGSVSPEKIFIMGGINSLTDKNSDACFARYRSMIADIRDMLPDSQLYIESILPVSEKMEKVCASNASIRAFNERLRQLAEEEQITYVNLYPLYESNGYMDPQYSGDGVHLYADAYDSWAEAIRQYVDGQ